MEIIDWLEINFKANIDTYNSISRILNVNPSKNTITNERIRNLFDENNPTSWKYVIKENESEIPYENINKFLDILENKYEQLNAIGIERKDILVWLLYGYDSQCNMEFDPAELKRLGENGIKLCISCWQDG